MAALTGFDTDEYLNAALAAGADGFIIKGEPLAKVRDRLLQIHAGDVALAPEAWRRVLKRYRASAVDRAVVPELSKAEIRILELTTRGLDCKSIAQTLGLSVHTVYAHNKRIFAKLGVNSRVAAAAKYRELAAGTGLTANLDSNGGARS
jgi:DNA-binding NarL/FixJ family response regulator